MAITSRIAMTIFVLSLSGCHKPHHKIVELENSHLRDIPGAIIENVIAETTMTKNGVRYKISRDKGLNWELIVGETKSFEKKMTFPAEKCMVRTGSKFKASIRKTDFVWNNNGEIIDQYESPIYEIVDAQEITPGSCKKLTG